MQLGVTHALLVSRGAAPDYVVGVSAGAINAAALAEILQAGGPGTGKPRLEAQVDKFRQFLNAYREMPYQLVSAILPDTVEVTDRGPLKPIELPIHFREERASRAEANRNKAGLIRLLDHIWRLQLTVGTATRFIRLCLTIVEIPAEAVRWKRFKKYARALSRLLLLGWRSAGQVAPLFWDLLLAFLGRSHAPTGATAADRLFEWKGVRRIFRALMKEVQTVTFLVAWPAFLAVAVLSRLRHPKKNVRAKPPGLLSKLLQHFELGNGLANSDVLKATAR